MVKKKREKNIWRYNGGKFSKFDENYKPTVSSNLTSHKWRKKNQTTPRLGGEEQVTIVRLRWEGNQSLGKNL